VHKEWKERGEYFEKTRSIPIHPAWLCFIDYCSSVKSGEIEMLKIQNGLPIMAEEVKKNVRFSE
jgi:hypothetical protein